MPNLLPPNSRAAETTVAEVQSSGDALTLQSVTSIATENRGRDDMNVFFGIGMAINIIMVVAFFIWALKQWKKHDEPQE